MSSIKQIRANRENAKHSTGPKTAAGKEKVRFNSLDHGLRAESAVLPGEDQARFDQHRERLFTAWLPQDEMESSLVDQIAVNQWKLARIDRAEARLYTGEVDPCQLALAIHRFCLTQVRMERAVSNTIADLVRYRQTRLQRMEDTKPEVKQVFDSGLIFRHSTGVKTYAVLPKVRGVDGVWREIPRELLNDIGHPKYTGPFQSAPPIIIVGKDKDPAGPKAGPEAGTKAGPTEN